MTPDPTTHHPLDPPSARRQFGDLRIEDPVASLAARELTLTDLTRIMRESAGEDENVNLDGDILDVSFSDLGYDSLALLETAGRIEREFGIRLGDDTVGEAETPRQFLDLVNATVTQPV
jgi:act minimal PKS acyl carrier protein